MNMETKQPAANRVAGAVLVLASVASVFLMAHHPTVSGHGIADAMAETSAKARTAQVVHGGLIVTMGALMFGFLEVCSRLGLHLRSVRAALIAYFAGSGAMLGATLISGFLIPSVVARYEGQQGDALEPLRHLLILASLGNRTLANFGVAAMSAAILLWSLTIARRPHRSRVLSALGLLVSTTPPAALLASAMRLDVHGMSIVVAAQSLWNIAMGAQVLRRKL